MSIARRPDYAAIAGWVREGSTVLDLGCGDGSLLRHLQESRGVTGVTYSGDASRIFIGGFGGTRYAFKDNLSGVARLGFGASYLTLGVDLRL